MLIEIGATKDEIIISHYEVICPFMVRQAYPELDEGLTTNGSLSLSG
jgi:hypothetical protein